MKSIFIIIIDYNELFTYYTVLNGIVMLLFIGILFVGQWSTDESKNKMVYNGLVNVVQVVVVLWVTNRDDETKWFTMG